MILELAGVTAGFEEPVLTAVDLRLDARRTVLLGANGSGKSTLLRVLSGAHHPSHGAVLVDGVPLRHTRRGLREHRRRVQLVLQDPDDQLFSADVRADVSFGPMNLGLDEATVGERVTESLTVLGIEHLANRPTHQLSYGERRRAAIAGAVAMHPEVLLLDEPTSGLDPEGIEQLLETLTNLETRGTRLIMATHDVDLALGWADRALVLTPGGLRTGDVTDVLADGDLLAAARLRAPWPLELRSRLSALGLDLAGPAPRSLDDVVGQLLVSAVARAAGAHSTSALPDGETRRSVAP